MNAAPLLFSLLFAAAGAAAAPACPPPHEVRAASLHGLWRAEFEGLAQGATLLLEKHPEYVESFRGGVNRGGQRNLLSGELEDGELVLEESEDGRRIAATWVGELVAGACGREIRGSWRRDGSDTAYPFVLRKL